LSPLNITCEALVGRYSCGRTCVEGTKRCERHPVAEVQPVAERRPCVYRVDDSSGRLCGRLSVKGTSRCERHPRRRTPQEIEERSRKYDYAWNKESRRIRAAWVEAHGWVCPGWGGDEQHESHDLCVDHDVGVLCRHHNSVKAATYDRRK